MQVSQFKDCRAIKVIQVNDKVKHIAFADRLIYSFLLYRQKQGRTDVASTKAISRATGYSAEQVTQSLEVLEALKLIKCTIPIHLSDEQRAWFKFKKTHKKEPSCLLDDMATWLCYVPYNTRKCGHTAVAVWSIAAHCKWSEQKGKNFLNSHKLKSQSYLSKFLGFSKQTIDKAFDRLKTLGIAKDKGECLILDPTKIKQHLAVKKKSATVMTWETIPVLEPKTEKPDLTTDIRAEMEASFMTKLQSPAKLIMVIEDLLKELCTSAEGVKLKCHHLKSNAALNKPNAETEIQKLAEVPDDLVDFHQEILASIAR